MPVVQQKQNVFDCFAQKLSYMHCLTGSLFHRLRKMKIQASQWVSLVSHFGHLDVNKNLPIHCLRDRINISNMIVRSDDNIMG